MLIFSNVSLSQDVLYYVLLMKEIPCRERNKFIVGNLWSESEMIISEVGLLLLVINLY